VFPVAPVTSILFESAMVNPPYSFINKTIPYSFYGIGYTVKLNPMVVDE
jgi:hypothetical protein